MKSFIYILFVIVLASCGSAEMSEKVMVNKDYINPSPDLYLNKETKGNHICSDTNEIKDYIKLKLKDLIELQALLHNPEVNHEMKRYAKDMILKIVPNKSLLTEKYLISSYNLNYIQPELLRKFDGNGNKNEAYWNLNLYLPQDTLLYTVAPIKTDNGTRLLLELQVY